MANKNKFIRVSFDFELTPEEEARIEKANELGIINMGVEETLVEFARTELQNEIDFLQDQINDFGEDGK